MDGTSHTLFVGEIAFDAGGWALGASPSGGGAGGGQGFARAVIRWWRSPPACAQPGINPPQTTCNNSVERSLQMSSSHQGGIHAAFCDGRVVFVNNSTDKNVLRALTTRKGGETADNGL